jgi:Leucine-rich repeat (LRR) protein
VRQFAQFPPALAELPSLAELDMEGNQLTSLVDIGQLTALERLYLNSNRLVTLPPSMGKLRSLKYLQLRANQLTSLPEGTSCVVCVVCRVSCAVCRVSCVCVCAVMC